MPPHEIGQRIGGAWLRHTCGQCPFCTSGHENLCEQSQFTGYHADGGYAEYAVLPEAFAYQIPQVFGDVEASPLLCAGIIGYRALKRSCLPKGGRLRVVRFRILGAPSDPNRPASRLVVYVATRDVRHQELAKSMGAAWAAAGRRRCP